MWVAVGALALQDVAVLRAATQVALWGFVATVFVAVSHRMIPFFSASALPALDAWRPMWLLWTMVAALWGEAFAAVAALGWGPLPFWLRGMQAAIELPVTVLLLWLALRWGVVQSLKIRMLAMLHAGFLWLGLAYALSALSHALMATTGGELSLGLAPILVQEIFNIVKRIRDEGTTVLLVEQNVRQTLAIADRAYVLETGRVEKEGRGQDLLRDPHVKAAYLGL